MNQRLSGESKAFYSVYNLTDKKHWSKQEDSSEAYFVLQI